MRSKAAWAEAGWDPHATVAIDPGVTMEVVFRAARAVVVLGVAVLGAWAVALVAAAHPVVGKGIPT